VNCVLFVQFRSTIANPCGKVFGLQYFAWQVPALLDATIDVAGGNVNIHVLMAFAALASVVMGSALEGGLLLAMFSLSHLGTISVSELV
jgi:hypothetical protein